MTPSTSAWIRLRTVDRLTRGDRARVVVAEIHGELLRVSEPNEDCKFFDDWALSSASFLHVDIYSHHTWQFLAAITDVRVVLLR